MSERDPSDNLKRAFSGVLSDANFAMHAAVLGLTRAHFEGKTVLDIGSGRSNKFANTATKLFKNTFVASVNPLLAYPSVRTERGINPTDHVNGVAALAQGHLPFKDRSFDTITSVLGVPNALQSQEVPALLNDIWRTLKPSGQARLWPYANQQTGARMAVIPDYVVLEPVPTEILDLLPELYSDCTELLVISKPTCSELPDSIAQLKG